MTLAHIKSAFYERVVFGGASRFLAGSVAEQRLLYQEL